MKKILLSILFVILLVGCGDNTKDLSYTRVFEVIDIQNGNVIGENNESITTEVPLSEFNGKNIKIGDTIEITYDYVFDSIKKVEIKKENDNVK